MSVETQDTSHPNSRAQAFSALLQEATSRGQQLLSLHGALGWALNKSSLGADAGMFTLAAERRSCRKMYFWPSCSSAGRPSALRADEKNRERLGSKDGLGSSLLPGRSQLQGNGGDECPSPMPLHLLLISFAVCAKVAPRSCRVNRLSVSTYYVPDTSHTEYSPGSPGAPRPAGSTAGSLWGLTSKLIHWNDAVPCASSLKPRKGGGAEGWQQLPKLTRG